MRITLLLLAAFAVTPLLAQQEVSITRPSALEQARDIRKIKAAKEALATAGYSPAELSIILEYGDRDKWPQGIRSDTARGINAPYVVNYTAFRLCRFMQDSAQYAVLMVPGPYNLHMPDDLRPLGDFYLALPDSVLEDAKKPQPRPAVSRGPRWEGRPKASITRPEALYAAYNLGTDTTALEAMERNGWSQAEIDAVIFRSTERNWPDGIDNFTERYPRINQFRKYKAYVGVKWDDKVLLIVPTARNRRMPVLMRPYMDLYFIYAADAVKQRGK